MVRRARGGWGGGRVKEKAVEKSGWGRIGKKGHKSWVPGDLELEQRATHSRSKVTSALCPSCCLCWCYKSCYNFLKKS